MKTKSVSEFTSFNSRIPVSFVSSSLGILLALVILAGLSASAQATQCEEVEFDQHTGFPFTAFTALSTQTSGATIFYTIGTLSCPADPTHTGGTQTGNTQIYSIPIGCPVGAKRYIKALAYKAGMTDSIIICFEVDNTGG
jgi:hypothetical protein